MKNGTYQIHLTIIKEPNDDNGHNYWVTMGKYRFEQVVSRHDGFIKAKEITWDRILQVVTIIIKTQNETNFINEITK